MPFPLLRFAPQASPALLALALVACKDGGPAPTLLPEHTVMTEPAVPAGSVFRPPAPADLPQLSPTGYAFHASLSPDFPTVLLTAQHLLSGNPTETSAGTAISLPSSPEVNSKSPAGDIAAFACETPNSPIFEIAPQCDQSHLWLAVSPDGSAPTLHPVQILTERRGLLYYSLDGSSPTPDLGQAAGAPLVNAAGKVVALHLGGATDPDGSHFGIGNPVSRFLPHLLAAMPEGTQSPLPGEALAGAPAADLTED